MPGTMIVRKLYISPEIKSLIYGPWEDADWEARCYELRADFDRYTTGQILPVASKPFGGKTSYLKRLDRAADEVWEIRSIDPDPGLRIFGRFALRNHFIALTWSKRRDLKGPHSREWRDAMESCKAEWRKLLPAYDPITSEADYGPYLTNYFSV